MQRLEGINPSCFICLPLAGQTLKVVRGYWARLAEAHPYLLGGIDRPIYAATETCALLLRDAVRCRVPTASQPAEYELTLKHPHRGEESVVVSHVCNTAQPKAQQECLVDQLNAASDADVEGSIVCTTL